MNVGDIVELNSGSPPLTVVFAEGDIANVRWFCGDEACMDGFPKACLKPFSAPAED